MALAMKFILAISMLFAATAKPSFPSIHQLSQAAERRLDAASSTDDVCVDMATPSGEAWSCDGGNSCFSNGSDYNCCCKTCEQAAATFCPNGFPINPDTGENITGDGDISSGSVNCGSTYYGVVADGSGGTTYAPFWEACCACGGGWTHDDVPSICSDQTSCTTECAAYSDCYMRNYAACSSTICTCPNVFDEWYEGDEGEPSDACVYKNDDATLGWVNWVIWDDDELGDQSRDFVTSCDDVVPHVGNTIYSDTCSAITDAACAFCTECASEMEDYLVCAFESVMLENFGLTCDLSDSCNHVDTSISMANKAAKAFSVLMGVLVFGTALAGLA